MGLGTKDVKVGGGSLPKTIQPGRQVLKITKIELKQFPFMVQDEGYYFIMHTETSKIEGFEGFWIDKNNESLGRYDGQVGQVKTNKFYYKDGTTKGGVVIVRDMELLKQLKNVCIATDCEKWFDDADGKHETIEDFVDAINKDMPYAEKYIDICVAGKEFKRNSGHIGFDLFTPKLTRGTVAYEPANSAISKVIEFDADEHWEKFKEEEVAGFGDDNTGDDALPTEELPAAGGVDVSGAPDFEL